MAIIKVITPSVTDANITTAKVTDNAITLAKMASGTDGNIISYDASGNPVAIATGSDGQVLTSTGAGSPPAFETPASATNTPAFFAHKTGNQTVAQDTQVLIAFETEIFDTNNTFTNTAGNYKFTPGVSGKYVIYASLYFETPAAGNFHRIYVYKNGSSIAELSQSNNGYGEGMNMSTIVESDTDDYFQIYTRHNKGSALTVQGNTTWGDVVSGFGAHKLIT
jgi:hypothetical protein